MTRTHVTTAGAALLLAALGGLAAGCGGASGPSVAQISTTTTSTSASAASAKPDPAAFSRCMRAHGVPRFPDPTSNGDLQLRVGPGTGIDPQSATFRAAQRACQHFMPTRTPSPAQQKAALDAALKFSACMRAHGLPKFPDPQAVGGGGIRLGIRAGQGLDPNSPLFQAAQKACAKYQPGGKGGGFKTSGKP